MMMMMMQAFETETYLSIRGKTGQTGVVRHLTGIVLTIFKVFHVQLG